MRTQFPLRLECRPRTGRFSACRDDPRTRTRCFLASMLAYLLACFRGKALVVFACCIHQSPGCTTTILLITTSSRQNTSTHTKHPQKRTYAHAQKTPSPPPLNTYAAPPRDRGTYMRARDTVLLVLANLCECCFIRTVRKCRAFSVLSLSLSLSRPVNNLIYPRRSETRMCVCEFCAYVLRCVAAR